MNILIAGVGGQGTLLASRVIGGAAISAGFDVKVSEVHGMSQRGGSVVTYVRYGNAPVRSPIIDEGGADAILAFEQLEAYRALPMLAPGGFIIMNAQRINPVTVNLGLSGYPGGIAAKIRAKGARVTETDALAIAMDSGSPKAVNIVLTGIFASREREIAKKVWIAAIENTVPSKFLAANLKAFETGYALGLDTSDRQS